MNGLIFFLSAMLLAGPQDDGERMTMSRALSLIPRPGIAPVKSLIPSSKPAADTLDTSDPRIKIELCSDGTWRYLKDWEAEGVDDIFTECWVENSPAAYHVALNDLPLRMTIPLVDSASRFCCPYVTKVYSPFGYRHGRRHQGVDLPLHKGDPVRAAFDGRVRVSTWHKGYGNLVIVRHGNGLETIYGHLSERKANVGDWVSSGDVLGLGGSTGRSTGPHLHFETRYKGYAFDPQWIIDFESAELRHGIFSLKRKYLSDHSRYVPESEDEEEQIYKTEEEERAEAERIAKEKAAAVYHKVRSGDTLYGLALKYHTNVASICKLNGITPKTVLKLGRSLRIK